MTRKTQAWMMTHAEVYGVIFQSVQDLLRNGGVLATRIGDEIVPLSSCDSIRQLGPFDIQICIHGVWSIVDQITVDEWAKSLDIIGPSDHFKAVEGAIGQYPVPAHVIADYSTMAGLDKQGQKQIRKLQPTRVVDDNRSLIPGRFLELPRAGDTVEYVFANMSTKKLTISAVLSYRPYDMSWLVGVREANYRFVVQRIVHKDGTKSWTTAR